MGRKKKSVSDDSSSKSTTGSDHFRHLGDLLAGVIFGCTDDTYDECVKEAVFGLPVGHWTYVQGIKIGTPLFLFNYSRRELHGVYAAASQGRMNLRPYGWTKEQEKRTMYPAQVRIKLHKKGTPLKEKQFKFAIRQNYTNTTPLFQFELDVAQVKRLCRLFKSTVPQIQSSAGPSILEPPQVRQSPPNNIPVTREGVTSSSRRKESLARKFRVPVEDEETSSEEDDLLFFDESYCWSRKGKKKQSSVKSSAESISTSNGNIDEQLSLERGSGLTESLTGNSSQSRSAAKRRTLGEVNGLFKEKPARKNAVIPHRKMANGRDDDLDQAPSDMSAPTHDILAEFLLSKQKEKPFTFLKNRDAVFLFGGVDEEDFFAEMEVLQEESPSGEGSLLIPGFDCINSHALSVEDGVYLLGGGSEEYNPSCAVERLMHGWKEWQAVQPMPNPRAHFAASSVGNGIFTMGGGYSYCETAICEQYDCGTDSWMTRTSLQQERYGSASCSYASAVFVSGGGRGGSVLKSVEMMDCRAGFWQTLPPMLSGRKHHAFILYADHLWAMGGEAADGSYLSSVEAFDLKAHQWTEMPSFMHARAFFTAEIIEGTLHVLGGHAHREEYRFLGGERYDTELEQWKEGISVGSSGRRGFHASCTVKATSHSPTP